jgi:hypothetical protein
MLVSKPMGIIFNDLYSSPRTVPSWVALGKNPHE